VTPAIDERLLAHGFLPAEADRRALLLSRAVTGLRALTPSAECRVPSAESERLYHVPGRIEVLGKHTDYAGGRSLICATEQGFAVAVAPRTDSTVRLLDAGRSEMRRFPVSPNLPLAPGDWSNYARTVALRLARDFPGPWLGLDLAFAGDLPPAAGVSSSSALVVATALALGDANGLTGRPRYRTTIRTPEDLAGYLGAVENGRPFGPFDSGGGVGTLGGSQDHTAILCCRPGRLSQYGFNPVRFEGEVPVPDGWVFAIASSGVVAEKAGAALRLYNAIAERTARLWELVRDRAPAGVETLGQLVVPRDQPVGDLRDHVAGQVEDRAERERLVNRLAQLTGECATWIPQMADALRRGDMPAVGRVAAASQAGAERGLENQIPETRALVRLALERGAAAASAFGAGFGGSVWALVGEVDAPAFLAGWRAAYQAIFPEHEGAAGFFLTRAAPPACRLGPP
jgi:galactokinase